MSSGRELVFKVKAEFLKSPSHPIRLEVIEHLKGREASVGDRLVI